MASGRALRVTCLTLRFCGGGSERRQTRGATARRSRRSKPNAAPGLQQGPQCSPAPKRFLPAFLQKEHAGRGLSSRVVAALAVLLQVAGRWVEGDRSGTSGSACSKAMIGSPVRVGALVLFPFAAMETSPQLHSPALNWSRRANVRRGSFIWSARSVASPTGVTAAMRPVERSIWK